jgi:hypothetical protein
MHKDFCDSLLTNLGFPIFGQGSAYAQASADRPAFLRSLGEGGRRTRGSHVFQPRNPRKSAKGGKIHPR